MDKISDDFSHLSVDDPRLPSNVTFPNSASVPQRVSPERDTFTDDDHKALDKKILKAFSAFRRLNEEPDLPSLLSIITLDKRLITLEPDDAEDLLQREPFITSILRDAWQGGSFKEVRQLEILWPNVKEHEQPSFHRIPRLLDANIQLQAISNAWNERYTGNNHELLLRNINHMSRGKPYSNSVAILQSSGSGKSRMVREQSDLVFTLPFNLRAQSDDKSMAYPPPDNEIRNYLDRQASILHEGQIRYLHLLGHIFGTVSEVLDVLYKEKKERTYTNLATNWRKHMEKGENRFELYRAAVQKSNANDLDELQRRYPPVEGILDPPLLHAVSKAAKETLDCLLKKIDNCCETMEGYQSGHVKLMLYFDEAHILGEKRVQNDRDEKDIQLAPPGSMARSGRARENADALQAPITETPFDCSPKLPIEAERLKRLKLEDLYDVEFMAQFGRPMFWALLAGATTADHKNDILSIVIDLARSKLICDHNIFAKHTELKSAASTAVLDVILNLDFEPRREAARNREAELVAGHMRTAFSVPQHREYFRSGYPSEPILAEAAVCQMELFQSLEPGLNVMAGILKDNFHSGLLDQGSRGEVVMRLLVSEAYRRAVKTDHPNDRPYIFSKGCKLVTFVAELFAEDYATRILDSVPDNVKSRTKFSQAFKESIIRFTHFGKMADDSGTTTTTMFAAFVRCMAIICWSSQNVVDLLIPVLVKRSNTVQESAMTGLLIQVKRRKARGSIAKYEINQKALAFFPTPPTDKRPYITLVAELGVQRPISEAAATKVKVLHKLVKSTRISTPNLSKTNTQTERLASTSLATPSKLRIPEQPSRISHPGDVHPRYSIFAYGCSNTVYKVIIPSDRSRYKFLLGNRDLLDEHARQDELSLSAVRRMKASWSVGPECYGWIDVPMLQNYQVWDDDDGEVFVGGGDNDDGKLSVGGDDDGNGKLGGDLDASLDVDITGS